MNETAILARTEALAKAHADLCLRVSQNQEELKKALLALEQQCAAVAHSHAQCMMTDARSIEKLEAKVGELTVMMGDTRTDVLNVDGRARVLQTKVEQIDTVLDHDTDSMLLSSLCKRVADLEDRHYGGADRRAAPVPIDPRFGSGDSRPHEVIALFNGLRTKLRERYGVSPDVLEQIDLLAKEIASKFHHGGREWWQT